MQHGEMFRQKGRNKEMEELKAQVFDLGPDGWLQCEEPKGCQFWDKTMIKDGETGMVVNMSRYPKGFWKPYHRHTCSHGIFVISGKLKTDDGVYGPGSFVWHPAGYKCGHGATDEEDCTFLFVANKPFDIEFLEKEEQ